MYEMVMAGLLWVAEWMVRLMPDIDRSEMPPPMPPLPSGGETESGGLIPETLRNALRLGWSIMMAGLLLLALWRISAGLYRWLRRRMAAMSGAEFEPMPGAFRADLLAFLKRLVNGVLGLGRFFRRRAARPPLPPEVATVRQIYRQFLHWAAAAGFPRRSSQTPYEYQYELIPHLETGRGEVDLVTRQYVRTRYGARPLSDEELQQLRQSWYNIRQSHPGVDERKERLNRITGGKPRLWI
ncbi:MAG: hypothetical protein A2Z05_00525 [Chloroflexi bacterium RBG_16_60_22]|nr:MAG: hypothetical protein A2Z05_00525 [Chloroflexi bacterium RBG_16_60_22]